MAKAKFKASSPNAGLHFPMGNTRTHRLHGKGNHAEWVGASKRQDSRIRVGLGQGLGL